MEQFFTRQVSNEGKKFPLFTPDGGVTEHWICVCGIDSDVFKRAEATAKRQSVELSKLKDVEERAEGIRVIERDMIARLIIDWSFEMECTHTNVVNFLAEAPQIEKMVNHASANRTAFFGQKS